MPIGKLHLWCEKEKPVNYEFTGFFTGFLYKSVVTAAGFKPATF